MSKDDMQLKNAGWRERNYAEKLFNEGKFPKDVTLQDVLDNAMYDPHRDMIYLTIKAVVLEFEVLAP